MFKYKNKLLEIIDFSYIKKRIKTGRRMVKGGFIYLSQLGLSVGLRVQGLKDFCWYFHR